MSKLQRLRVLLYSKYIAHHFAEFGAGCRVSPPFRYSGLNYIRLGRKVNINSDCWILTIGDESGGSCKIEIGEMSQIGMGATISAAKQILIGESVLLARNVYISDHGHAYDDVTLPIMDQGISAPAPVSIGRGSWIGQNAVILPGTIIGEHCVIGANSVVNCAVPDFTIAVGAPARLVKQYDPKSGCWVKLKSGSSRRGGPDMVPDTQRRQ